MSNFDSDGPFDNEWDDRGELAWNEFDWEHYLREQDDVVHRYLAFYEKLKTHPERVDEVAHMMGWDRDSWRSEGDDDDDEDESTDDSLASASSDYDTEPYTLHKNPIFIATKAIYLSLKRAWERTADDGARVPQRLALNFQTSLHRGEEQATLAIQALDFGDYAMAISLFKRALRDLNSSLALLGGASARDTRALSEYRDNALPRLFDLREIWLRVMNECREELERPVDNDEDED